MHFKSISCCKWSLSSISWGPAPRLGLLLGGQAVPHVLNVFYLHKPACIYLREIRQPPDDTRAFLQIHTFWSIVVMYLVTGLTAKLMCITPYSTKFSCQLFGVWHAWMEALQVHADTGNITSLNGSYTSPKILHCSSLITEISDSLAEKESFRFQSLYPPLPAPTVACAIGKLRPFSWVSHVGWQFRTGFWMRLPCDRSG